MAIDSKHPSYSRYLQDWTDMELAYAGERAVKEAGIEYLPPTVGMYLDGMSSPEQIGYRAYMAYKTRAQFPDYVSEAVETMIGMIHRQPATIQLPKAMEPLRERATKDGESLLQLLRRINEQQLVTGRLGLLPDLPPQETTGEVLPYIALYSARSIINWDDTTAGESNISSLNLVVLDESTYERQPSLEWKWVKRYRVLVLGDPQANEAEGTPGVYYRTTLVEDVNLPGGLPPETAFVEPQLRGRKLEQIPFVFVNSKDLVAEPDDPPLLGLGRACYHIYRSEADYRQNLHLQGQDTLVIISSRPSGTEENAPWRTGTGATIEVDQGGDAKYIGVSSQGLPEQRQALDADRERASRRAGALTSNRASNQESGDALRIRVSAQTASLTQIAQTGAAALQAALRHVATWMGADPEEVVVTPNLEFAETQLTGQDMLQIANARKLGYPISRETMHTLLVDKGLTSLSYEEELDRIAEEDAELGLPPPGGEPLRGVMDEDGGQDSE